MKVIDIFNQILNKSWLISSYHELRRRRRRTKTYRVYQIFRRGTSRMHVNFQDLVCRCTCVSERVCVCVCVCVRARALLNQCCDMRAITTSTMQVIMDKIEYLI